MAKDLSRMLEGTRKEKKIIKDLLVFVCGGEDMKLYETPTGPESIEVWGCRAEGGEKRCYSRSGVSTVVGYTHLPRTSALGVVVSPMK